MMKSRVSKRKLQVAVLALAVAAVTTVLGVSLAGASKGGDFFIGVVGTPPTGTEADGATFNEPRDVAANHETGQIYVADSNNHRIQRLDADGNFQIAWGRNVSESATTGDDSGAGGFAFEICAVAADCQGGTSGAAVGGYSGVRGGMFDNPLGVAIDPDTGDLYVTDRENFRVQRFSFDDAGTPADPSDDLPVFEGAFGSNTVPDGGAGDDPGPNEVQVVTVDVYDRTSDGEPAPGGSFSITFDGQTTGGIAWPPNAATIQSALEGLPNVAPGDVAVTEPTITPHPSWPSRHKTRWTIEFAGSYALTDVPLLGFDKSGLVPGASFSDVSPNPLIQAIPEGDSNYEICVVAAECKAGVAGQSAGAFGTAGALDSRGGEVAIDVSGDGAPGTGQVFVTDPGNQRVTELSVAGEFVRSWGRGVDSGEDAFEICTGASGCVAGLASGASAGFSGNRPILIAVDAAGIVHAVSGGFGDGITIERFDSTVAGEDDAAAASMPLDPYRSAAPPTAARPLHAGIPGGMEFDPVSGNLLYLIDGLQDTVVQEFDVSTTPPTQADIHMGSSGANQPVNGLGVLSGAGGDRLYVVGDNNFDGIIDHRILVLTDEGAGPFELALGEPPVSGIGPNGATFHGTVNAEGPTDFPASYRFEYSEDGSTWTKVPADEGPFSDGEDHELEDTIAGLDANTEYKVRLAGVRAFNGGTAQLQLTGEVTFTTLSVPAEAETLDSTLRTDTTATLIGRLHPQNAPTDWYFEWGSDESYGNTTPVQVANGNKARVVSAKLEGLDPESTYHYRLVADNGVGEAESTVVFGGDATVTTRTTPPALEGRAYEMVTPPFKATRSLAAFNSGPRTNLNPGVPSLDGDTIAWKTAFFPLTEEVDAIFTGDMRYSERTPNGWSDHTGNTLGVNTETSFPNNIRWASAGSSGDLKTLALGINAGVNPDASEQYNGIELDVPHEGSGYLRFYTRRDGTGHEGFTGWLRNPDTQHCLPYGKDTGCDGGPIFTSDADAALLNDDGTAMARWGAYRGLAEDPESSGDEDPSDDQQLAAGEGGSTAYLQRAAAPDELPAAAKVLVNECTGVGAGSTKLPNRPFSGPSTTVGLRSCGDGNVVHVRGAQVGSPTGGTQTALSNDGHRIFFTAPDPGAGGTVQSCTTDTGVATNCPPQLYVRQHGPGGEEFVRWISRSRSEAAEGGAYEGAPIAFQRMTQLDGGAVFQRASRDGRIVYFQTKMPLVPDDPNGGESITAGKASDDSWDLYRYELPADRSQDPDDGRLLRVSGGPTGTADPKASQDQGLQTTSSSTRFISEDGDRAYFLTEEPIDGADTDPPRGGSTIPGSGAVRNLYLFDDKESGAQRWRFIARIPYTPSNPDHADQLSLCASGGMRLGLQFGGFQAARTPNFTSAYGNCFRGTRDARQVIFHSNAQLTTDDDDQAADVFLYDAAADELIRVSAPSNGAAEPYPCKSRFVSGGAHQVVGFCNAHLNEYGGAGGHWVQRMVGNGEGMRGWNGLAYMNVSENPDGTVSVFFMSRAQLLFEDTNGDFTDVYEWREGELSLITPGNEDKDAWFSGNSMDGEDLFFITEERIDPREIDDDLDLYDARVGGGFPYAQPPTPCDVLALECEAEAISPPGPSNAATLAAGASGNVGPSRARPGACGKAKLRRGRRCVRKVGLARKRCRKLRGRVKRRCVRKQLRRLTKAQKRQRRVSVSRLRGVTR